MREHKLKKGTRRRREPITKSLFEFQGRDQGSIIGFKVSASLFFLI